MLANQNLYRLLVLSLFILITPALAIEDSPKFRQISAEKLEFQINVPSTWQITLNERLRGKAFFRAHATNENGELLPAGLFVIYTEPATGKTFPQMPDPEAYVTMLMATQKAQGIDAEVIRTISCELDNFKGVLVETRQKQAENLMRLIQMNIVAPDGSKRFIVTYGTVEELAGRDMPVLERMITTIKLSLVVKHEGRE